MKENRKVAVVTGAAGGIGKVIVNMFADNGFTVIAVDVNSAEFSNRDMHFQKADLCSHEDICRVFEYVRKNFGGVHVLVNNGAISTFSKSVFDITPEEFHKVIDTNFMGVSCVANNLLKQTREWITAESSASPL